MTSGFVDVEGGRIFHETRGEGPDVVLVHAGYLDSRMWDREMDRYAGRYRVTRYDVRGYGRSTRPGATYSDAADLLALLDHVGADQATLVGVSNGGRIALDFAVEHPDRVRALVLLDFGIRGYEPADDAEEALWDDVEREAERGEARAREGKLREAAAVDVDLWTNAVDPQTRERLVAIATDNAHVILDPPQAHQVSPQPPAFHRLDVLTMPVLMIVGERDVPGQIAVNQRVHERVPGSTFVVVPGADHVPSLSTPEAYDAAVDPFLAEVTG